MEPSDKKKKIITILVAGVLLLAIPFSVTLIQQQQELRSKAGGGPVIEFSGDGVTCNSQSSSCTTTGETVTVNLRSPLGSPGTPTGCPGGANACGDNNYGLLGSCGGSGPRDGWSWAALHPDNKDNATDTWCKNNVGNGRNWCYACIK